MAYFKELVMMPMLYGLMGSTTDNGMFVGFLAKSWNGFPNKSAFRVSHDGGSDQVRLLHRGWTKQQSFTGTMALESYRTALLCDQLAIRIDGQEVGFDVRKGIKQPGVLAANGF